MLRLKYISVILLLIVTLTSCNKEDFENIKKAQENAESMSENVGSESTDEDSMLDSDEVRSYLSGECVDIATKNARPVAVMVSNIEQSLPQAGIGEASVIYEAPVEGRITRLMCIYDALDKMPVVGPVRSSRDYFAYLALEYDAIYTHFGQADLYVGELLNSDRIDNLSGAVSGIDNPATHSFVRSTDRKAPHNVFTVTDGMLMDIDRLGYGKEINSDYIDKFSFNIDGKEDTHKNALNATYIYPGGKERNKPNGYSYIGAYFEYNEKDGKYYRYEYEKPQIDVNTGNQLVVDNVILQYCHGQVRDENDYLAFEVHGDRGFKAQVFSGGKVIDGTWKREADNSPAIYYDKQGDRIDINPGKTWICIVWDEYGEDVYID